MNIVVNNTTTSRKPVCGILYHAQAIAGRRYLDMPKPPAHRPTFIRQWRKKRGYSLDRLAEMVPMDKSNLSKVERGFLPYNQEMIERIADALMTDPASLLMRDPSNEDAIWTIWDNASPGERVQIQAVAQALIQKRSTG